MKTVYLPVVCSLEVPVREKRGKEHQVPNVDYATRCFDGYTNPKRKL